MLTIVAKNVIKEGKKDDFVALANTLINASRQEDGCMSYELFEDSKMPNMLTFIEQWRDMKAIVSHNKTEHFKAIFPKLGELLQEPMEINIYKKLV